MEFALSTVRDVRLYVGFDIMLFILKRATSTVNCVNVVFPVGVMLNTRKLVVGRFVYDSWASCVRNHNMTDWN